MSAFCGLVLVFILDLGIFRVFGYFIFVVGFVLDV